MKANAKKIVGAVIAVLLIAALAAFYFIFREKPSAGAKKVTLEVINSAAESVVYTVDTDAEYLRQVMEEAEGLTFEGTESEYGLTVSVVNGERADYTLDGAYWSFYVNDEYCNYGIDTQPVNDGDRFKIAYTPA